jgi:hypothetical protein
MAFKGSEVTKGAIKYWRLSKDKRDLLRALEEVAEVRQQEDVRLVPEANVGGLDLGF